MKLFKVSIDNNPGGWKSGEDPSELVIAETPEDAIEMVKNGWTSRFNYNDKKYSYTYGFFKKEHSYITEHSQLSAIEIKFQGLELTTVREQKLKRIIQDEKS